MSSMDFAASSRPKRTTTHKDVETTEQTHRRIGGGLRGGLDHRGDSPVGSASVGTGKYSVGGFCRRARVDLSAVAVFQHFLGLAGGIRDPARDRRALHLRENAARDLGETDAERNRFPHSNARDIGKYFLPIAVACYVAFWIALAVHTLDRSCCLLENVL